MSRKLRRTLNADTLKEDAPAYQMNGKGARVAPPAVSSLTEKKKLIPFGWYGGKFSYLDWLLPLLPDSQWPEPRPIKSFVPAAAFLFPVSG
jgi:hypothetical protein